MSSLHDSFWSLILPRALTIMEDWVGRQLHYEMIVGLNIFLSYVECWILSNMESCLSIHHVTLLEDWHWNPNLSTVLIYLILTSHTLLAIALYSPSIPIEQWHIVFFSSKIPSFSPTMGLLPKVIFCLFGNQPASVRTSTFKCPCWHVRNKVGLWEDFERQL